MNLVTDIGNTLIKTAVFEQGKLVEWVTAQPQANEALALATRYREKISRAIISAVAPIPDALAQWLSTHSITPLVLDSSTALPFENTYQTPETLGKDRIAAIAGAQARFPDTNLLVIDAGTAITYDVLSADKRYLGGNISPGIAMRYKALHSFTSRLPLLKNVNETGRIGNTTQTAIENGVQNGAVYEMRALIDEWSAEFNNLCVLLTGGDAHFFENNLKKTIFVVSNLTLEGLNIILEYNAKKF